MNKEWLEKRAKLEEGKSVEAGAAPPTCELCGEPMPKGEEMFKYHGYSGPCPTKPNPEPAAEGRDEMCICGEPKSKHMPFVRKDASKPLGLIPNGWFCPESPYSSRVRTFIAAEPESVSVAPQVGHQKIRECGESAGSEQKKAGTVSELEQDSTLLRSGAELTTPPLSNEHSLTTNCRCCCNPYCTCECHWGTERPEPSPSGEELARRIAEVESALARIQEITHSDGFCETLLFEANEVARKALASLSAADQKEKP